MRVGYVTNSIYSATVCTSPSLPQILWAWEYQTLWPRMHMIRYSGLLLGIGDNEHALAPMSPASASSVQLFKRDVVSHVHVFANWVINPVRLGSLLVAVEHARHIKYF